MCAPVHVQRILQLLRERLDACALLQQLASQVRHLRQRTSAAFYGNHMRQAESNSHPGKWVRVILGSCIHVANGEMPVAGKQAVYLVNRLFPCLKQRCSCFLSALFTILSTRVWTPSQGLAIPQCKHKHLSTGETGGALCRKWIWTLNARRYNKRMHEKYIFCST